MREDVLTGSPTKSVSAAQAYNRGVRLRETDKAQAVVNFTEAIEIDPEFEMAIYNRALTYIELCHAREAMSDLASLRQLKSDYVSVLDRLVEIAAAVCCHHGHEAIEQRSFAVAIEKFSDALIYAVEDPVVLEWRAYAYESSGDDDMATQDRMSAKAAREQGVKSIAFSNVTE